MSKVFGFFDWDSTIAASNRTLVIPIHLSANAAIWKSADNSVQLSGETYSGYDFGGLRRAPHAGELNRKTGAADDVWLIPNLLRLCLIALGNHLHPFLRDFWALRENVFDGPNEVTLARGFRETTARPVIGIARPKAEALRNGCCL